MMKEEKKEKIGKSLGRIPSGIAILTTQSGEDQAAMLSSWFQQVSFDPPLISVAIRSGRHVGDTVKKSGQFVLNLLHTGQKNFLAHFGKGFDPGQDPFVGISLERFETGIPILKEALCFLECELQQSIVAGDHELFIGKVIHGGIEEEGQPMVHLRRNGFNY